MSEHDIDIDALRQIADDSGNDYVEEVLGETIAELERLRAENARLAAKVERLTVPLLETDVKLLAEVAELRRLMAEDDDNHRHAVVNLIALRSRLYQFGQSLDAVVVEDALALTHRLTRELAVELQSRLSLAEGLLRDAAPKRGEGRGEG